MVSVKKTRQYDRLLPNTKLSQHRDLSVTQFSSGGRQAAVESIIVGLKRGPIEEETVNLGQPGKEREVFRDRTSLKGLWSAV